VDEYHTAQLSPSGPDQACTVVPSEIFCWTEGISTFNNIEVPEEVLQVHGFVPSKKVEGTVLFDL
jgi:hypothetical protein